MSVEKRAIRRELRARRRQLSRAFVEDASARVCAQLRSFPPLQLAASVVAYVADDNEIDVGGLLDDIVQSGRRLFLPQNIDGPALICWRPGSPLAVGRGGVPEPADGVPELPPEPAVALLPMVAWDAVGTRLGRGGGFYDRLFAGLAMEVLRIGLAYEFQQCTELPRDAWDVPVHYVITERRIVPCRHDYVSVPALRKGGLQP